MISQLSVYQHPLPGLLKQGFRGRGLLHNSWAPVGHVGPLVENFNHVQGPSEHGALWDCIGHRLGKLALDEPFPRVPDAVGSR